MTSFGWEPTFVRTTVSCSPGFASIRLRLYFMLSLAVISTVRGPAGAGAAAVDVVSFWPQPEVTKAINTEANSRRRFVVITNQTSVIWPGDATAKLNMVRI